MKSRTTLRIQGSFGVWEDVPPVRQFRGTYAHAELFNLHEEGKITSTEFVLCLHIDSLVQARGLGCFASNSYFGDLFKVTTVHISRMLNSLIKLGLVVIKQHNPRIMETTWSRISTESGSPPLNIKVHPPVNINVHHTKGSTVLPNTVAAADAAGDAVEDDPVLLNGYDGTPPKIKHTPEHLADAIKLRDALHQKQVMVGRKISVKRWADEIATLVNQIGSLQRVRDVLEWYLPRIGNEFIPEAYSGKGFRQKFPKIESAMKKDQKRNPTVTETPLGSKIYDWASRFKWPKGADSKLRAAVEVSLVNYTTFSKHLRDWVVKQTFNKGYTDKGLFRLATEIQSQLGSPQTFFDKWWGDVFKSVKGWKTWSGDLLQFVFDPKHKIMTNMGRDWSKAYCGEAGRWDKLMEVLNG